MRILLATAALLALAACDKAPDKPAGRKPQGPETGATAEVSKLSEGQRNIVLAKAIRAAGGTSCLSVEHSERAEMVNGARGWKAECDDGSAHLIEILANGTANVTSRTH